MNRHTARTHWLSGLYQTVLHHRLVFYVGASVTVATFVQLVTKGV